MKIKLLNDGKFEGLVNVEFPVEIECEIDLEEGSGVDVPFDTIAALPGFEYCSDDTDYGAPYYFYSTEFEVLP